LLEILKSYKSFPKPIKRSHYKTGDKEQ
jgi:hypothetical protein